MPRGLSPPLQKGCWACSWNAGNRPSAPPLTPHGHSSRDIDVKLERVPPSLPKTEQFDDPCNLGLVFVRKPDSSIYVDGIQLVPSSPSPHPPTPRFFFFFFLRRRLILVPSHQDMNGRIQADGIQCVHDAPPVACEAFWKWCPSDWASCKHNMTSPPCCLGV